ncbi:MAG TPA: argininosuccinate lyase [Candidatus Acidoferrales bacterium]|nr:argininosuccinate lyase [Candidatus Acidoferrales bacterium]
MTDDRPPHGSDDRFPAPVYAETVLAVNFEDARRYFLDSLLEIHAAHALMLARAGILAEAEARACLEALASLDRAKLSGARFDGGAEDLFFYVHEELERLAGAETAGRLQTARSRNDIDIALYRMRLRAELLRLAEAVLRGREVLVYRAAQNLESLMPAYTHTQPAQPTTVAHYLMAAAAFAGRDLDRLRAAFDVVNRSPLGACAITTTGFPIDRSYTAELLGFEGLVENSYDAIAGIDYVTGAAGALASAMVNLGRLAQDLLLWCTEEFGALRLSGGYVQSSSIMPQKRNPVALEHARILSSKALGQAQAILTAVHNTPFGDIDDNEDDLQPLVLAAFHDGARAWRLFAALFAAAEIDRDRLRRRSSGDFLTVTELADTLVRREGLSFTAAHHLVAEAVRASGDDRTPQRLAAELKRLAPDRLGRPLRSTEKEWLEALDPEYFVRVRVVRGGPAPAEVSRQIDQASRENEAARAWLNEKTALLARYPERIRQAARERGAGGW